MSNIKETIHSINQAIRNAEISAGREKHSVQLLAVSKGQAFPKLQAAYDAGIRQFAENYLQEGLVKISAMRGLAIDWHYLGNLQSNKIKTIAEHFSWVQTVCTKKQAEKLNHYRPLTMPSLNVCIEVNLDQEKNKLGVSSEEVMVLAENVANLPRLSLRGLMVIPSKTTIQAEQAAAFARMTNIYQTLLERCPGIDTLSMGMSADFPIAIAHGATMVRLGTAIFGRRSR